MQMKSVEKIGAVALFLVLVAAACLVKTPRVSANIENVKQDGDKIAIVYEVNGVSQVKEFDTWDQADEFRDYLLTMGR